MFGYIIFVRFFVNYTPSFPFDRFVHLKDEDINGAVETFRHEWWSEPVNRTRFEAWRIETDRRRIESDVLLHRRFYQGAPIPALPPGNVQCLSVMYTPAAGVRVRTPSLLEIATCVGWTKSYSEDFLPHCISHRYPVARFDTNEIADDAATALNARVSELTAGASATQNRNDLAVLLCYSNPRFVALGEEGLSRPEIVMAREQIQRLRSPVSGTPTAEELYVREYWSLIVPTLDEVEALTRSKDVSVGGLSDADRNILSALANAPEPLQALKLGEIAGYSEVYVRQRINGVKGRKGLKAKGLVESVAPNQGYQITPAGRVLPETYK